MKLWKASAVAAVTTTALVLAGCGSDGTQETTSSSVASSTTSTAAIPDLPTVEQLNDVLTRAIDPAVPIEEKVKTVQGGENAPELFETIAHIKDESGADFHIVPPVLPGEVPEVVLTSVVLTVPDKEPTTLDSVEFVFEDGQWKLSQKWACSLVHATVAPEQVPAMCQDDAAAVPGAPAPGEIPAPEEGLPAPEAPAPEVLPAPEQPAPPAPAQ